LGLFVDNAIVVAEDMERRLALGEPRERAAAEAGRTMAVLGLSLPLPLADRYSGALREALLREDQAREALQAATLKLQLDITQASTRLRLSREQARQLADAALPTARTACETALRGYELGK
ncbi:TolC family protein, partial [Acinetobacter baumannii]